MITRKDQHSNLVVDSHRITQLAAPVNKKDAVNLDFMYNNTLCLQNDEVFSASGRKITNLVDGVHNTDAINGRQMYEIKQYVKSEMYKLVKVFQIHIDKLLSYIYKLNVYDARNSLGVQESELKLVNDAETRTLVSSLDKGKYIEDWRSVYVNDE